MAAGMSVSWADFNQDGLVDLYVSNMFSSAGGRITDAAAVHGPVPTVKPGPIIDATHAETLCLRIRGDGTFVDRSQSAGVTMARWAWGSTFVDLNNDGYEDLLAVNGFVTGDKTDDL